MDLPNQPLQPPRPPAPTPAPTQPDVSYVVMPNLARKTMIEPPTPAPTQRPQQPAAKMAELPHSDESNMHLNRKWIYIGGGIVLLGVLAVLLFAMLGRTQEKRNQPQPLETKLPKVWLMQYFGSETCLEAQVCGDEADSDTDGLTNYNEFKEGTNPKERDTDKDGLADGDEINIFKTDPSLKYTDRRDIATTNDYNDAISVSNNYDPLTPGIKMTESRLKQIVDDTAKYQLHEPSITTINTINGTAAQVAKNISIFIENDKFNPEKITINKGDTIIWLNKDQVPHMIATDPHPQHTGLPTLVSPELTNNQTYSFKFESAGTFRYHDHLNPQIKGTVEVK